MEIIDASTNPQVLATIKMSKRYANPTVVALTGMDLCDTNVSAAKITSDKIIRIGRGINDLL